MDSGSRSADCRTLLDWSQVLLGDECGVMDSLIEARVESLLSDRLGGLAEWESREHDYDWAVDALGLSQADLLAIWQDCLGELQAELVA